MMLLTNLTGDEGSAAEAAFMAGLERNSDIVYSLISYAYEAETLTISLLNPDLQRHTPLFWV